MVMMLRQCCCGCTLKTGTIILGWLDILGGLKYLIFGIVTAAGGYGPDNKDSSKVLVAVGAAVAVIGAIQLLVSICLVGGAKNGNPALLVPWMVYNIVFVVAFTIYLIYVSTQFFAMNVAGNGVGCLFGVIIFLLLETYVQLLVYSLYRELKGTAPPNSA